MSLDERLRRGLGDLATDISPDDGSTLRSAEIRGRRLVRRKRALAGLLGIVILGLGGVLTAEVAGRADDRAEVVTVGPSSTVGSSTTVGSTTSVEGTEPELPPNQPDVDLSTLVAAVTTDGSRLVTVVPGRATIWQRDGSGTLEGQEVPNAAIDPDVTAWADGWIYREGSMAAVDDPSQVCDYSGAHSEPGRVADAIQIVDGTPAMRLAEHAEDGPLMALLVECGTGRALDATPARTFTSADGNWELALGSVRFRSLSTVNGPGSSSLWTEGGEQLMADVGLPLPALSPDGATVAVLAGDGEFEDQLVLLDTATGTVIGAWTPPGVVGNELYFDGRWLLANAAPSDGAAGPSTIFAVDVRSGEELTATGPETVAKFTPPLPGQQEGVAGAPFVAGEQELGADGRPTRWVGVTTEGEAVIVSSADGTVQRTVTVDGPNTDPETSGGYY